MLVTALGHAGLRVDSDQGRVLCDPWFSPEGAFQASWFQFPRNQHLVTHELCRPDALLISHEHLDHVDPWFLARVPPDIRAVVPQYPSDVLRRKILASRAREVVQLPEWEPRSVAGNIEVFFAREESPMNHDAAMVIRAGNRVLLNLNDARLSPPQLRRIVELVGGRVDVLALQGAGASWYPICYEYDPARMRELCLNKRRAKLEYVASVTRVVEPAVVIPFAGPPCFLDPALEHHNQQLGPEGIFPDQQQVAEWLGARGIRNARVLLPGDVWDADDGALHPAPDQQQIFGAAERARYVEAYAQNRAGEVAAVLARHPEPAEDLWGAFRDYFEHLLGLSPYFNDRIAMRVGFDVRGPGGGGWTVDFRRGHLGVVQGLDDCQYRYRFESRWLPTLLSGETPWEDFLLSLRFSAWREPDKYNDHLLGLLKFASRRALRRVEDYERSANADETITVRAGDRHYRIQRYCPHAGQDLAETGVVQNDGVLLCLGHHYEFSLETGECLNGSCPPLRSERLSGSPDADRPSSGW